MKKSTVNYLVAGTVVLLAISLLFVVLYRLTGRTGDTDPYFTHYQNVAGIKFGTPVYFEGFRVGQVDAITPIRTGVKTRFKIDLSVDQGWPIPADSTADIASAGLLSDVFISIRQGEEETALAVGSEIKGNESADVFAAFANLASEVNDLANSELRPLLQLVNERVDSITGDIKDQTPQVVDQMRQMMERLNISAESIRQLVGPENSDSVARTLANVEQTSATAAQLAEELRLTRDELHSALEQLDELVADNRPGVDRMVSTLEITIDSLSARLDAISYNLDEASRNFNEFTRGIRQSPSRLLFTPDDDSVETER